MGELSIALLKTLHYGDLFDYPLKAEEAFHYLISAEAADKSDLCRELEDLVNAGEVEAVSGLYFLPGRRSLVETRNRRELLSDNKVNLAHRVAGVLSRLPWIKMVGLTGALAMKNSQEFGDIDLMVVTSRDRLWLSRLFVFFFLKLFGLKRKAGPNGGGQICINLWCDENNLLVPEKDRDLVVAHEVAQMKVLFNHGQTYERFIGENLWLKKYLANWRI